MKTALSSVMNKAPAYSLLSPSDSVKSQESAMIHSLQGGFSNEALLSDSTCAFLFLSFSTQGATSGMLLVPTENKTFSLK